MEKFTCEEYVNGVMGNMGRFIDSDNFEQYIEGVSLKTLLMDDTIDVMRDDDDENIILDCGVQILITDIQNIDDDFTDFIWGQIFKYFDAESWHCHECLEASQIQYRVGKKMLFNGNEGDGWQVLDYEPLPEDDSKCNFCEGGVL